ncbi:hypothetical protein Tco_0112455, partial [Tanacetum coccineum]
GRESVRYGVSNGFDTAYRVFLGVGTTLDIFQNIHILYFQYGVLVFSGYGVLGVRTRFFKISLFKLQNARLFANLHQELMSKHLEESTRRRAEMEEWVKKLQ